MFIKRQLAVIVMMSMGFLALSGYFLNFPTLREFTDKDAPQWYMIIAGFAAFLGCLNLLQLHIQKVVKKQENWQYSIFTLLGFSLNPSFFSKFRKISNFVFFVHFIIFSSSTFRP